MIKKSLIESEKWSKKGQKGITLIALIITVIVLLILSTVTLYNLTDKDSSMLESVETQREDMLKMEVKQTIEVTAEKIKLEHATNKNLTLQEFKDELEEKLKKNDSKSNISVYLDENSDSMYKVNYNNYSFSYYYNIEINN